MGDAPGGWVLLRGARSTWETFRAEWDRTPEAARQRWLNTLAVGLGLTSALVVGLTLLARSRTERGLQAWDERLLPRVESAPLSFDAAIWWDAFGASSMLIPLLVIGILLAIRGGRPLLALSFLTAYLGAKVVVMLGWRIWDRPRPELIESGIAAPPLQSYPSGHAVQTAMFYGLVAYFWIRQTRNPLERALAVLLFLALLGMVSLARLRLGTHWPSDVIAGILIGLVWLATLIAALHRARAAGGR